MEQYDITLLVDTREHFEKIDIYILDYFRKRNLKHKIQKLNFGDYSFEFNGESFENKFVIERKSSLTELAANFSNGRKRFENEFIRAKEAGAEMILMIENGSFGGILNKTYNTNLNIKAFYASLLSFRLKFKLTIDFVHDNQAGLHIYWNCYYYLRNYLKGIDGNENIN